MKRHAVYGIGAGIHGREAAMQATQRALDQVGTAKPVLALVFFSQEFDHGEVLAGLTSLLGETPLWGFSSVRPLACAGDQPRSVIVALVLGSENRSTVQWFPYFSQDSATVARQFVQSLRQDVFLPHDLLVAADGVNGSLIPLCNALRDLPVNLTGGMASGDPSLGRTYQIGKNQSGPGGLSVLVLGGRLRLSIGLGHGWQDLGVYFHATRTRDVWLQSLDGASAAETYARLFGYAPRDWAFPPLTEMVRMYPLGVEVHEGNDSLPFVETNPASLLLRSALRVEVDGSFRMSAPVPEGAVVHLMTGDPDACLEAARSAARTALETLGERTRPLIAIALVDAAWQVLFETRPTAISEAIKSVIKEIPLVGAYTFGQLHRPALDQPPVLHNQNIAILMLGESQDEKL